MTDKQREFLQHLFLYGDGEISQFSGRVIHACCRKGWIEVDDSEPYPYGDTADQTFWRMTDAGRQALHEATS